MLIDIHSHLLHGMDDGPRTFEETAEMLRSACSSGITHIAATPHMEPGVRAFDLDIYLRHLEMAREYCVRSGLQLTIHSGCELFYTNETSRFLRQRKVLPLGKSRNVLVEFPTDVSYHYICHAARDIGNAGYNMILAHAERYRALQKHEMMDRLRTEYYVKIQINADTILRCRKWYTDPWVRRALKMDLIDAAASDAHGIRRRPLCLRECMNVLREDYGRETAAMLCCTVPAQMLGIQIETE